VISQSSLVSQAKTTFVRSFGTTTYLFREGWEDVVVLDGAGDWLWRSIAEPCSIEELAADVTAVMGHDRDMIHAGLLRTVEELRDLGAVELLDAAMLIPVAEPG